MSRVSRARGGITLRAQPSGPRRRSTACSGRQSPAYRLMDSPARSTSASSPRSPRWCCTCIQALRVRSMARTYHGWTVLSTVPFAATSANSKPSTLTVIGISSQSPQLQRNAMISHRIGHWLLRDPALVLARHLGHLNRGSLIH